MPRGTSPTVREGSVYMSLTHEPSLTLGLVGSIHI